MTLLTLCLYAALSGMVVLLPYLLIASAGWAATAAGAALLPLSVVMGLGSRAAGKLAERVGTRMLLTVGPFVVAVGFALFLRVGAGPVHYATDVLPALLLVACGLTLSVAPLTSAVIAAVDPSHVGSRPASTTRPRASPACSRRRCSATSSPPTWQGRRSSAASTARRSSAPCSRSPPPRRRSFSSRADQRITRSARTSTACGTFSPSASAVLRLTIVSIVVGCSIGSSAGFVPRRTRSA